ncbi:MAG: bifunctional lysylphosphatidylglycerol flippase/synthetase MprF [Sedimentisphaerales bacterium]|jgi:phosphatidylglycerol lysyltransferase
MNKSLVRNSGYLISLALFSVAIVALHHELRHYHLRDVTAEIRRIKPTLLGLSVGLTVLDYLVLTVYDALALRYIRHRLHYVKIALASFIGYVFSHNLTILGGSTARYRVYSALGVSAGEVSRLVIFCSVTFWLGFFSLAGMVFFVEHEQVPETLHLPFTSARPAGVILLASVLAYFAFITFRRRPLNIRGWELAIPSIPISLGQVAVASLDWVLACGVLYALLPASVKLSFFNFLGIFMLAQGIGLLSYVPGGLGVFETVVLLLLSDHLDNSAIVSSLILYRLIYYLLPLGAAAMLLVFHELVAKRRDLLSFGVAFGKWSSVITPHVLAVMSFIAGAILLFSGALPAEKGRMDWVADLLPLPAVELSHFLGSLVGAGLLILARGLQRRVGAAYHLTIALLGAGIAFSLLKGLDYEEAVILTAMLLIFLPCHREFYRRASAMSERLTFTWITLIAAVLISAVWLVLFSYKHVEYSNQLWWRFAVDAQAPRSMRATMGAAIGVLLYSAARLLFPKTIEPSATEPEILRIVEGIVSRSRKVYANLALLGDKSFLTNRNRTCFIMYGIEGRSWVAMGDPVGPKEEWQSLLWTYRELCDLHDGWPVFYQVESDNLGLYLDLGMTFLKLGEEGRVPLKDFSLAGSSRKRLRYAYAKLEKENCIFSVVQPEQVSPLLDELRQISDTWLSEKDTREKGFSIGFFEPEYMKKLPIAIVRQGGGIIAFANIWPGAEHEELSIDLMRHLPSAPNGIMDYLFVQLMLWGKQQGYEWFNLGMAPMSGLEDRTLAPLWHKVGTFVFRHGEHFYNFQGLRQYKDKFDPVWKPKYLACRGGLALPRILANIATLVSGGLKGVVMK